jgi:hypothetical protein
MAQLDESRPSRPAVNGACPHAELHSPVLDPADQSTPPQAPEPEVQDWISKARESIEAFGGFIGIGGAGISKSLLVQREFEDSESSESEDDFEIEVQNSDGSADADDQDGIDGGKSLQRKPSSQLGVRSRSCDRASMSSARKRDSGDKPMNLPSEAVPFGLMANLALRRNRRSNGNLSDNDGENIGVANEEFFRSSQFRSFSPQGYGFMSFFFSGPAPDPKHISTLNLQQQGPHILTRGIVTPKEVEKLFNM